jgi:L-aspartate oxidase
VAPATPPFSRAALQELMWENAGLVRDAQGLTHAASVLAAWRAAQRTPGSEAEHEDENLLVVAQALVDAALARRESVGAHHRSDAPPAATPPESIGSAPEPAAEVASASMWRSYAAEGVA